MPEHSLAAWTSKARTSAEEPVLEATKFDDPFPNCKDTADSAKASKNPDIIHASNDVWFYDDGVSDSDDNLSEDTSDSLNSSEDCEM